MLKSMPKQTLLLTLLILAAPALAADDASFLVAGTLIDTLVDDEGLKTVMKRPLLAGTSLSTGLGYNDAYDPKRPVEIHALMTRKRSWSGR